MRFHGTNSALRSGFPFLPFPELGNLAKWEEGARGWRVLFCSRASLCELTPAFLPTARLPELQIRLKSEGTELLLGTYARNNQQPTTNNQQPTKPQVQTHPFPQHFSPASKRSSQHFSSPVSYLLWRILAFQGTDAFTRDFLPSKGNSSFVLTLKGERKGKETRTCI